MVPVFSAHCKSLTGNQKASQINTFIFMAASWHCLFCFNPKFLYIYILLYYIYICPHTHTYIYISYIIYIWYQVNVPRIGIFFHPPPVFSPRVLPGAETFVNFRCAAPRPWTARRGERFGCLEPAVLAFWMWILPVLCGDSGEMGLECVVFNGIIMG